MEEISLRIGDCTKTGLDVMILFLKNCMDSIGFVYDKLVRFLVFKQAWQQVVVFNSCN